MTRQWEYDSDELTWQIPLSGVPRHPDVPDQWAAAICAVGHDLAYRRHGRPLALTDETVAWVLRLTNTYGITIGVERMSADTDFGGFSVGNGYTLDCSAAQASVWLAEALQDDLAGYEFVQWPIDGNRLLTPAVRDNSAVWVRSSSGAAVAAIGELSDQLV